MPNNIPNISFNDHFLEGEVLLIDKELNWTSFDVVNKIRKLLEIPKLKVGHAGTLDPLASGLLIVCTGRQTKQINQYQNLFKEYEGTFILGEETPSYDKETAVSKKFITDTLSKKDLYTAAEHFVGSIEQVPPEYSAVKIGGRRAYTLARKGQFNAVLNPKKVYINSFEIGASNYPVITFKVTCSKGTYIRSLVRDFARKLENGAHLTKLVRTKIGDFCLKDALTIEQFIDYIAKKRSLLTI